MSEKRENLQIHNSEPFNNTSYNAFFHDFYTPLCRFALQYVNDKAIAEDIVQDLFVYLWENWSRLSVSTALKSYAYTAVKNKSLNYLQKNFRKENLENLNETVDSTRYEPLSILEGKELEAIIEKALESLPNKCRAIFVMKRYGELTHQEIAGKLNISVKTIEAQMTIAIRKISDFLKKNWELMIIILIGQSLFQ